MNWQEAQVATAAELRAEAEDWLMVCEHVPEGDSHELRAAVLLLAAVCRCGPGGKAIQEFTGIPTDDVHRMARRLRDARIWLGDGSIDAPWRVMFDPAPDLDSETEQEYLDGIGSFFVHIDVATGDLCRQSDGSFAMDIYRSAMAPSTEQVTPRASLVKPLKSRFTHLPVHRQPAYLQPIGWRPDDQEDTMRPNVEEVVVPFGSAGQVTVRVDVRWLDLPMSKFTALRETIDKLAALGWIHGREAQPHQVELESGGRLTLAIQGNPFDLTGNDRDLIASIADKVADYQSDVLASPAPPPPGP